MAPSPARSGPGIGRGFWRIPGGSEVVLDDGRRAFVRVAGHPGANPPILLLHGLGATGALNWPGCFGPLSRRSQVIALDQRGHGRGPRVGNQFRLADCADDAAAVIRTLGVGPAIVVGHSMGGAVAQLLAHRHPDLVAGLVLSATSRDFRGRTAERIRFRALGALTLAAPFGPASFVPALPVLRGGRRSGPWALDEVRHHEPAAVVSAAASLGRFTSREWVGDLDVPAAVIVHRRDRLVPPHRQVKLAQALPGATVVEVDLDHMGVSRRPGRYLPALMAAHATVARAARARA